MIILWHLHIFKIGFLKLLKHENKNTVILLSDSFTFKPNNNNKLEVKLILSSVLSLFFIALRFYLKGRKVRYKANDKIMSINQEFV